MRVTTHFVLWLVRLARAETQTTAAERACLERHARNRHRLVEIGVWHGVNTRRLRAAMAPDGVLFAVDPFPKGRFGFSVQRYIARREVSKEHNGSVAWQRTTGARFGQEMLRAGAQQVDFIFIDGDHSYEGLRGDWEAWAQLVTLGGIVALHDTHPTEARPLHDAGSAVYTREVITLDARFETLETIDSLTVLRRRNTGPEAELAS